MHGHRAAHIDPLNKLQREDVSALDPARYGLRTLDEEFDIDGIVWYDGRPFDPTTSSPVTSSLKWSLEKITEHLRSVYVGAIAYEFMHSPSKAERLWFAHLLESEDDFAQKRRFSDAKKKRIWEGLVKSEVMDTFLQDKFPNLKRYGLEGAESMMPALDTLFNIASKGMSISRSALSNSDSLVSGSGTCPYWHAPPRPPEPIDGSFEISTSRLISQDKREL